MPVNIRVSWVEPTDVNNPALHVCWVWGGQTCPRSVFLRLGVGLSIEFERKVVGWIKEREGVKHLKNNGMYWRVEV